MKNPISATSRPSELDPREWNFVNVAKSELVACCYWEYMRESKSLRDAVDAWKKRPKHISGSSPSENELLLMHTDYPYEFFTELPFPNSWQSLDETQQKKLAAHVLSKLQEIWGPPFYVIGDRPVFAEHEVGIAEELFRQSVRAWRTNSDKTVKTVQATAPISFLDNDGVQSIIAQINWQEYTNVEISKFIQRWITKHRPKQLPGPSERGKGKKPKTDYANKLRDLGIMRLMNKTQFGNMKLRQTEAWRIYHGQHHWMERYWYLAKHRALKNFHNLLSFLPDSELPIHANTKTVCDKLSH